MSLILPKPPPSYDAHDQAQLRSLLQSADGLNYKKSPGFLNSLLLTLLTTDDYFIQRKSGVVVQRSPTQVAADIALLFTQLKSSGNVEIDGILNLVGGAAKWPIVQIPSSDNGTIDDYKKTVSFTPTVRGSTTVGTATYTVQTGAALKIGPMVWFNVSLSYTGGTGTGNLLVGGLPYTSSALYDTPVVMQVNNLNATTGTTPLGRVNGGSTNIAVLSIPVGTGASGSITNQAYDNAATIVVSGWYFAS